MTFKLFVAALISISSITSLNSAVNITFNHPEKFSDTSLTGFSTTRQRNFILEDFQSYVVDKIDKKFGDNYTINIVVNNIDLAGEFEASPSKGGTEIRIIKPNYPAKIAMDFEIIDPTGNVLKSGSEYLSLSNKATNLPIQHQQSPYLKEIIDRWIKTLEV